MGLYFILFFRTSDSSAQPPAHGLALNRLIIPGFMQVNSRISVPADRAVLWYSPSLSTNQISTTTSRGELNSFENLSQKFRPKIPKYAALGCFGETAELPAA